jgi:hypothetical protein
MYKYMNSICTYKYYVKKNLIAVFSIILGSKINTDEKSYF